MINSLLTLAWDLTLSEDNKYIAVKWNSSIVNNITIPVNISAIDNGRLSTFLAKFATSIVEYVAEQDER